MFRFIFILITATDKSQAITFNTPSPKIIPPTFSTFSTHNNLDATTEFSQDTTMTDAFEATTDIFTTFPPTKPAENFTRKTLQGTELPTDPMPVSSNDIKFTKFRRVVQITTKKNPDGKTNILSQLKVIDLNYF